jgi:threonine/homoserine/homoserine lactone efflux protein
VTLGHLAAFLAVSLVVIITPGPDTALTIRNTLVAGRAAGLATALGVVSGLATWALATSAGLAALLVASEPAFLALKLVGGAYLLVLGARALRSAVHPDRSVGSAPARRDGPTRLVAYRRGLVSNLGNPKIAVFFTSLLPQFAPRPAGFWALAGLGLGFCLLTLGWLTGYAVLVARAGDLLRRPGVRRLFDTVTGTVLVAFGLRLATESRRLTP